MGTRAMGMGERSKKTVGFGSGVITPKKRTSESYSKIARQGASKKSKKENRRA